MSFMPDKNTENFRFKDYSFSTIHGQLQKWFINIMTLIIKDFDSLKKLRTSWNSSVEIFDFSRRLKNKLDLLAQIKTVIAEIYFS